MGDTNEMATVNRPIRMPGEVEVAALNRIADALERLADVYLYVNDPEGDEAEQPQAGRTLPDGFRGMR